MPAIIEPVCPNCNQRPAITFYTDGSVRRAVCGCEITVQRSNYMIGDAYFKPHWWALRVVKAAELLCHGIDEHQEINHGQCRELVTDLEGAIEALKIIEKGGP